MQACVDGYVCKRKKENWGDIKSERASVVFITVEMTGQRVVQRSVVALAVRAWMRLVLQFLQRTCPSRG